MESTKVPNRFAAAFLGCFAAALLVLAGGCAELSMGDIIGSGGRAQAGLDEPTVAAGLKEALRVGTERAVGATSKLDGFLANELIRIALPEELEPVARALRGIGLGSQVDALEVGMNRAAERAAGEAKAVFWGAISQMTLADAFGILRGGETAATDYFRDRTSEALRARFSPIVSSKMREVGLYNSYDELLSRYMALPLVPKPELDLESYVTEKALSGLFTVVAQEETRIREDPVARTSELLRRVFGK